METTIKRPRKKIKRNLMNINILNILFHDSPSYYFFTVIKQWQVKHNQYLNSRMIIYSQRYLHQENGKRNYQIRTWAISGYQQTRAKYKICFLRFKLIYQIHSLIPVKVIISHFVWRWRYQKRRWIKCMEIFHTELLIHHFI